MYLKKEMCDLRVCASLKNVSTKCHKDFEVSGHEVLDCVADELIFKSFR